MQAWLASRYRAVNIYMGGSDRGCAQPNLTAGWVSTVVAQGWTLIPTYVGLQAPCWPGSGSKIDPSNAAAEGVSSADDAANGMAALGLGAGNPVYFDMENYNTGDSSCVSAVETFLDSWTAELHSRGYVSGVYSSASSGITNLVQETSNPSYHLPDDIWFAHWNGADSVYGDSYIPDGDWNNHQRIHQYAGGHNETYGGATLNIDNDAVDAATAPATAGQPTVPIVRAVTTPDGHVQLFWDANGVIKQNWYSPANGAIGGWVSPGPMQSGAQAAGNPAIVRRPGAQVIDVFTRSTDGQIRETWYNWGTGKWGGWIPISGSAFTGDPQVVATSDGHEQIFADDNGLIKQNWFAPANGAIGNWVII
jgi:hypothetical protein